MPQTFSENLKVSDGLVRISYNSVYVASVVQHKVTVRFRKSLQVSQIYACIDIINDILWSPDSCFILCVLKKRNAIQVLSIENPEWNCKADEGSTGLLSALWAPDSYHFLSKSELHLRITVWSISDIAVSYLKYPKSCPNNLAFSPGGRYLALLERREFHDHLSLFDCHDNWTMLRNILLATDDASGVLWSPDGRYLAIWDDCLKYRIVVHSVDGQQLCAYSAYCQERHLLGIKSVCWSPTGQLLAIGSYDQKCRLLNHANWKCLACLPHPTDKPLDCRMGISPSGKVIEELDSGFCTSAESSRRLGNDRNTVTDMAEVRRTNIPARSPRFSIYQEERTETSRTVDAIRSGWNDSVVTYELVSEPISIVSVRPDLKSPNPKVGIGMMSFSPCSRFLVTRSDAAAHVAWIWSIDSRLGLHTVLVHTGAVAQFAWDPSSPIARLAICTGSDCVFLWTPKSCVPVQLPRSNSLKVSALSWLPSGGGRGLLLSSDAEFCLCHLEAEEEGDNDEDKTNQEDANENVLLGTGGSLHRPVSDRLTMPRRRGHLAESCEVASLCLEELQLGGGGAAMPLDTGSTVSPLPLGSFGTGGEAGSPPPWVTGSQSMSMGDTPNWLRHRLPTDRQLSGRQCKAVQQQQQNNQKKKKVGDAVPVNCATGPKTRGGGQRSRRQAWRTPTDDSRLAGGRLEKILLLPR